MQVLNLQFRLEIKPPIPYLPDPTRKLCLNAGRLGGDALIETLSAPKIWRTVLVNRLSVNGFIISDHWDQFPKFLNEVAPLVSNGHIQYIEDVTIGLENTPKTFIGMLDGKNHGKTVIKIR